MVELAGYTARVATMVEVFEDCSVGKYKRNIVTTTKSKKSSSAVAAIGERKELEFKNGSPVIKGLVTEAADGTIIVENVRRKDSTTAQSSSNITQLIICSRSRS